MVCRTALEDYVVSGFGKGTSECVEHLVVGI